MAFWRNLGAVDTRFGVVAGFDNTYMYHSTLRHSLDVAKRALRPVHVAMQAAGWLDLSARLLRINLTYLLRDRAKHACCQVQHPLSCHGRIGLTQSKMTRAHT